MIRNPQVLEGLDLQVTSQTIIYQFDQAQFMPKEKNIVLIKGEYSEKLDQIQDKFQDHDVLELRATDQFIEMAIKLAEQVTQKGWAQYDRFTSSLAVAKNGDDIPQVSIKLKYKQPAKNQNKSNTRNERSYKNKDEQLPSGKPKYVPKQDNNKGKYKQSSQSYAGNKY